MHRLSAHTEAVLGEGCPVKSCVEEKKLQHCGECETFPCELAKAFAYDEKQGDGGERLKTCRCWKEGIPG